MPTYYDDFEIRLIEIANNLHRANLTVVERAAHVAEWVRLIEISAQFAPNSPFRRLTLTK